MSDKNAAAAAAAASATATTASSPARPLAACTRCHERKVKCDVSSTGVPCTNCSKEGVECSLRTRKSYAPRKRRRVDASTATPTEASADQKASSSNKSSEQPSMPPPPDKTANLMIKSVPEEEDHHVTSPLFVGDAQGIGFDVEAGSTQHLFVDEYIARILGPEELEYLSKKGVFTLPVPQVIESLMRAYFRHVHPMMPIVDAASFLKTYENEGVQSLNLLLLWSMFSASASFINDATLMATGFTKRKTLKESLFKKAKSLFDIGSERDKTVLIQSALLLSLWFVDIQDVFQTWHWSGIAINMSLNLGLHRNPDVWRKNPSFSGRRRQLWRRLWWTCVLRDRWASLSLGRPLRISFDDCDVPLPQESDITTEIQDLCKPIREKYALCTGLARHWIALIHLTNILGEIITLNYRPKSQVPSQQRISSLDTAINSAIPAELENNVKTLDASFFLDHLKLHREVILIVLYRRYIKRPTSSDHVDEETKSRFNSRENIKAAAGRCNAIVEHIVESNATHFITASMIPLFAPPMTSHLMEAKALTGVAKKLAISRLDVYLTLLAEFEDNYPTAAMLKVVYLAVRDKKGTNLSQELIELRRADSTNPFQNNPTARSSSSQAPPSSYTYHQPRSQTWDDIWLLEPFANFHWDALTPESDKALSLVSSDVYSNIQAPTPAASVLGTADR